MLNLRQIFFLIEADVPLTGMQYYYIANVYTFHPLLFSQLDFVISCFLVWCWTRGSLALIANA